MQRVLNTRGDTHFLVQHVQFEGNVYRPLLSVGTWMKKPLTFGRHNRHIFGGGAQDAVSATARSMAPRSWTTYELKQPHMHAVYRKYSGAVDPHNKAALEPGTLSDVWHTRRAWHRIFEGLLTL